jgi:hypothetical protein
MAGPNPINITPNNNAVNVSNINNRIEVTNFSDNKLVQVTQPITNVVEILTGPIGPPGPPGSGSVVDISYIMTGSIRASVDIGSNIFLIKSGSQIPFLISSQGALTISSSADSIFLIKNSINLPIFTISQSGMIILATQSAQLLNPAPNGAIYFTSSSFFIGLD